MTLEEAVSRIRPLDEEKMKAAGKRWDSIAKPLHSLGKMEDMITQIVGITGEVTVDVSKKALVAMWVIYTYAYIARFEQTLKLTLKNAALLALANLPKTALIFIVTLAAAIALMYVPVLIVILPALAAIFYEFILEKVFRKVMTPEDLAKEQEEDRFDKDL